MLVLLRALPVAVVLLRDSTEANGSVKVLRSFLSLDNPWECQDLLELISGRGCLWCVPFQNPPLLVPSHQPFPWTKRMSPNQRQKPLRGAGVTGIPGLGSWEKKSYQTVEFYFFFPSETPVSPKTIFLFYHGRNKSQSQD